MANPILSRQVCGSATYGECATTSGAITRTMFLLLLVIAAAGYTWNSAIEHAAVQGMILPILLVGFVAGLIVAFVPKTAPVLAPAYAVCEGAVLGIISLTYEVKYPGLPSTAVLATVSTLGAMLVLYKTGIVRPTERFMSVLGGALTAILVFYLIRFGLGIFHVTMPAMIDRGPIGIAISAGICLVAALCLIPDFAMIQRIEEQRAPKYMEWYAAFGLIVSLVWLYLEFLRLLRMLRDR